MRRLAVLVLAVALSSGCGGGQALLVDVLTDFVRGREFTSVRTELIATDAASPERIQMTPVFTEPGFSAFRVAQMDDVASGEWLLRATLLDETGASVASGRVLVDLSGAARVVTVVITRNCVDVVCGDENVCVDGQCVDLSCSPENPATCPDACSSDGECSSTGPDCVVGRCAEGICFEVPDDALCGGGVCEAASGCVGAPVDAGPPDAGPPDAGPADAGPPRRGATGRRAAPDARRSCRARPRGPP